MRLTYVKVGEWRNFRNVELEIDAATNLICLVGENGVGKSNLLELLSAISHLLGISPGMENRRGNPLEETHQDVQVVLSVTDDPQEMLGGTIARSLSDLDLANWDGTLRFSGHRRPTGTGGFEHQQRVWAGGAEEGVADRLAGRIVEFLRQFAEVNHVYLDADRAYPPMPVQPQQVAQVASEDLEGIPAKAQLAFRPTRTLYEGWATYLAAREQKAATAYYAETRLAEQSGEERPAFDDHFRDYRESVQEVLPHLRFAGIENHQPTFDGAGFPLSFDSLSGGEREIAFLLGQIDRFRLRRGLLFLDEPELHLNPDLVRTWLSFVTNTVTEGQVWIATHSLEAVEVAGAEATFVLERDLESRMVVGAHPLEAKPILAVLSRTLGSPAFSLANRRFVFIEGDPHIGERERFFAICGEPTVNRFMEAGNGTSVARSVAAVRSLAEEADDQVVIGGVIDRDFKSSDAARAFSDEHGVYVLHCHEIENFFLHVEALEGIAARLCGDAGVGRKALLEISDRLAGTWLLRRACFEWSLDDGDDWYSASRETRLLAGSTRWQDVEGAGLSALAAIEIAEDGPRRAEFHQRLTAVAETYRSARESSAFWKDCLGKEVLDQIARPIGLGNRASVERAVIDEWETGRVETPTEVTALRSYVSDLGAR
jgi:predicted ATPase